MISSMPKLDLDELYNKRKEQQLQSLKKIGVTLPAKGIEQWKEVTFADGEWKKMSVPGIWEEQGLTDIDGVVWFRKSFTLDDKFAGKEATVELGMIDDSDETFINGKSVGGTKINTMRKKYSIPLVSSSRYQRDRCTH